MDFIFDQFVELECTDGSKYYVTMASISTVKPVTVDTCNVWCLNGHITNVKMPARVLVQKIAQRRQEAQRLLRAAVVK